MELVGKYTNEELEIIWRFKDLGYLNNVSDSTLDLPFFEKIAYFFRKRGVIEIFKAVHYID